MGKRPQISDDLHDHVHDIHKQYTKSPAGSFEQALKTVVQLAEREITAREEPDPGWYPGKYLSEIASALSEIGNQETSLEPTTKTDQHTALPRIDPDHQSRPHGFNLELDNQVICKTTLDEHGRVTIPEPERQALGLTPGQILQLIAYPIEPNPDVTEEPSTESQ